MGGNPEVNQIKHIAFIMDGNGRWAKKRGLPRMEGHKAGADTVKRVLEASKKFGIKYVTLYAFSTENWKRPKEEVDGLMAMLKDFLEGNFKFLKENRIRLRAIGRTWQLPLITRKALEFAIEKTKDFPEYNVILALNYGGRSEIVDAVKAIAADVKGNKISPENINDEVFSSYLYAPDIPDPDLMIRTSGEFRISNFLLWELSYSELYITEVLWPDFGEKDLKEAIDNYYNRQRRFGGI